MAPPTTAAIPPTIDACLQTAKAAGLKRADAQALLCAASGKTRAWLLIHHHDTLPHMVAERFLDWVTRAAAGEPLPYLLGQQGFWGLELAVCPAVLIPRPDTETLVRWALTHLSLDHHHQVVDLGTGSGAIALALRHERPLACVSGVDCSEDALAVAQANGTALRLPVRWRLSHWWSALAGERFDLVVSNPPYIAPDDAHLQALRHEPQKALVSEDHGLRDLKHIIESTPAHLHPGGWLLLEHGFTQAPAVRQYLTERGFAHVQSRQDWGGHWRCSGGQWLGDGR